MTRILRAVFVRVKSNCPLGYRSAGYRLSRPLQAPPEITPAPPPSTIADMRVKLDIRRDRIHYLPKRQGASHDAVPFVAVQEVQLSYVPGPFEKTIDLTALVGAFVGGSKGPS